MDEIAIRALCLIVGIIIGGTLGSMRSTNRYVKRIAHNTEETRKMVEDWCAAHNEPPPTMPKQPQFGWRKNEKGVVELSFVNVGVLLCLLIVIASLFSTLNTNAKFADTQQAVVDAQRALVEQQRVSDAQIACTTTTLFDVVDAANGRTAFTVDAADANIALQQAQLDFLRLVLSDQPEEEGQRALGTYVKSLTDFIQATTSTRNAAVNNPYPTKAAYVQCLQNARTPSTAQAPPEVLTPDGTPGRGYSTAIPTPEGSGD